MAALLGTASFPTGDLLPVDFGLLRRGPGDWAVLVRGVPAGPLRVLGERMDPPDAGRWHSLWVECAEGAAAHSVHCGQVLVDEARLPGADPAALGAWRHDEPYDGLAEPDLVRRYRELEDLGLLIRQDVRPHDDHHRVLRQMHGSPTGSGTIGVGGARMTGWFTTWGDGVFPVYRDLAADGTLLRVRVTLGGPETVARQRRVERLWFGDRSRMALVPARITRDGAPVRWLYREEPDRDRASRWRVVAGDGPQDYLDDGANCVLVPLRDLLDTDPLFEQPAPAAFERATGEEDVTAVPPEDRAPGGPSTQSSGSARADLPDSAASRSSRPGNRSLIAARRSRTPFLFP